MIQIQLIQAPRSEGYADNSRSACYAPVGLISIATYCQYQFPQAEIEVLDGELISVEEIVGRLRSGAIVGIETKLLNYASALQIARAAKKRDCIIVLGGVFASALPETILNNQSDCVDFVVIGYGEKPMARIIQWKLGFISKPPRIIRNENPDFELLPLPNRTAFVDMERYIDNFKHQHPTWSQYRVANTFTTQGCRHHCIFCDRTQPYKGKMWFSGPQRLWKEALVLNNGFGIDYIVAFDDQIAHNLEWLHCVIAEKPPAFPPIAWHVFSNAEDIIPEAVVLLKKLPVQHVFIGIETGDSTLALGTGKGSQFTPAMSLEAVQLLTDAGIQITPSFVLGLPGETRQTLERTLAFARYIKAISGFEEIFAACLIPFPGSRAFQLLREAYAKFRGKDELDSEYLTEEWFKHFCSVHYETARQYVARILELGRYRITLDKGGYELNE